MNSEELQQTGSGCTQAPMGRPKLEDRMNVIDREGPVMGLRLTPAEHEALQRLIALQQRELDERGVRVRVSGASILRGLLQKEAEARGVWPADVAELPPRRGTEAPARKAKPSKSPRAMKARKTPRPR